MSDRAGRIVGGTLVALLLLGGLAFFIGNWDLIWMAPPGPDLS